MPMERLPQVIKSEMNEGVMKCSDDVMESNGMEAVAEWNEPERMSFLYLSSGFISFLLQSEILLLLYALHVRGLFC